jgi:hypothetical protein
MKHNYIVVTVYTFCFSLSTIGVWYFSPNILGITIKDITSVLVSALIGAFFVIKIKWLDEFAEPKFTAGIKFAALSTLVLIIVNQLPPFNTVEGNFDSHLYGAAMYALIAFIVSLIVMPVCGISGMIMKKFNKLKK